MELVTLAQESAQQNGFYVPQFEVKIQGVGLPHDVLRDVIQINYHDNIKEIDGFEITVNNWDSLTRQFKYVGAETQADLDGSTADSERYRLFDPCNKQVEVWMGYAGDLRLMLKGSFTTLEPSFNAGAPTLNVRGLNALHQLRRKQYSTTWNDKRDSEIARNIATLTDSTMGSNAKRFPMPLVIDSNAQGREEAIPYVAQSNQYDIDFLLARALRLGYVVYIREGDPSASDTDQQQQHVYFGPSDGRGPGTRDVTFRLRWGASLTEFKPTLTTARQVRSVTVNGWDRTRKKAITVKASLSDRDLNVNTDMHKLIGACDPREEIVVDKPVHTEREAKQIAQAILKDRVKEIVKASATCVGLPDLRAGRKVVIEGLGERFNGSYFVTDSTHTINDSGYITKFNARREVTGSLEGLR
jgi:phage protein D